MDAHAILTALSGEDLRTRLDQLDAERRAIISLLRAVRARDSRRPNGKPIVGTPRREKAVAHA